jgi:ribosomal protein S18 acetylase RimI-like enzyme
MPGVDGAPEVRRATLADLDAATWLFDGYQAFYHREHPEGAARAFLAQRLERGDSVVFLAWRDARAVGFAQLYPSFASLSLAPSWILNDLYVDPSARQGGTARALMEAVRQLAKANGAAEVFLQTAHDNAPARALYESLGYARDAHYLVYSLDPRVG